MYRSSISPLFVWVVSLSLCPAGLCLAQTSKQTPAQTPTLGQIQQDQTPELESPDITLDTEALLDDDRVFEESINSHVWSITPQPGRRLIQVPMIVTPGEQDTRLSTPEVKLRGGRFIAWRIIMDPPADNTPLANNRAPSYSPQDPSLRNFRGMDIDGLDAMSRAGANPPVDPQPANAQPGSTISQDIPVLARDMTVTSSGSIIWELERAIPGGEVNSGEEGYLLKLRPDRLQEMQPERPERQTRSTGNTRGGNTREALAQRREQEMKFREEVQAFRELRDHVRDLPDEFQARLPHTLWAIYEVTDRFDEFSFTGPAPMPWELSLADLESMRQTAGRNTSDQGLTAEDFTAVSQMSLMLANEHPLTQQMVANTLSRAGLLSKAETGDALYRLIQRLLQGSDPKAKRTVAAGLASTVPPTPATLGLLKGAFDSLDAGAKLIALSGMLAADQDDALGQKQMLETANQMIADPNGPGVVYVLKELANAVADKPDTVTLVGTSIQFNDLGPESLDEAIAFVAGAAGHSAVAAKWMELGLLGSSDPKVVRRTVEVLGSESFAVEQPQEARANAAQQGEAPADPGAANIPIDSANHSLYRVLNDADTELRELGWKAIRHFRVEDDPNARSRASASITGDGSAEPDRLNLILDAAFNETVTPPQLVAFLINQQNDRATTPALMRVVIEGRGPAITEASQALVESGRDLTRPLQSLDPEQRGTFSARLYESVNGSAPMVAALLRTPESNSQLIGWFARYVSTSGLPEDTEWAKAVGSEQQLLTLAASNDPDLADAAVAALVASVGGDSDAARELARQFANATDRSVAALSEMWASGKQEIFTEKLSSAAGSYRLIVNLYDNTGTNFGEPGFGGGGFGAQAPVAVSGEPTKSLNIAGFVLEADGQSIAMTSGTLTLSVSDSQPAIVITDPGELKNFGNKELNELPIEEITEPIELLGRSDGSWHGAASFFDGRIIEIVFKPE